jgi:hypothetical protein
MSGGPGTTVMDEGFMGTAAKVLGLEVRYKPSMI